jgi:predicted DNA-binding protein
MGQIRGMGRKTSSAITARFTNEETEAINKLCEETGIPRSVFIHNAVMERIVVQ